jgi:hypothetical protein
MKIQCIGGDQLIYHESDGRLEWRMRSGSALYIVNNPERWSGLPDTTTLETIRLSDRARLQVWLAANLDTLIEAFESGSRPQNEDERLRNAKLFAEVEQAETKKDIRTALERIDARRLKAEAEAKEVAIKAETEAKEAAEKAKDEAKEATERDKAAKFLLPYPVPTEPSPPNILSLDEGKAFFGYLTLKGLKDLIARNNDSEYPEEYLVISRPKCEELAEKERKRVHDKKKDWDRENRPNRSKQVPKPIKQASPKKQTHRKGKL